MGLSCSPCPSATRLWNPGPQGDGGGSGAFVRAGLEGATPGSAALSMPHEDPGAALRPQRLEKGVTSAHLGLAIRGVKGPWRWAGRCTAWAVGPRGALGLAGSRPVRARRESSAGDAHFPFWKRRARKARKSSPEQEAGVAWGSPGGRRGTRDISRRRQTSHVPVTARAGPGCSQSSLRVPRGGRGPGLSPSA